MDLKQAVILDVDGVLVDSYAAHFESWLRLADEEGLTLTEDRFLATFGRTSREALAEIWPHRLFSNEEIRQFDIRKERHFRELIEVDFPAMEGAVELIDSLAAFGFRLGVGSSGPRENVDLAISKLRIGRKIRAVVSGNDVRHGKPDPEVYRAAADRLDLPAQACLVVEDSEPGIAAAKAAGMTCIALHSTGHRRDQLLQADSIVNHLRELTPRMVKSFLDRSLTFSTR